MNAPDLLTLTDLSFSFTPQVPILRGITATVTEGDFIAIVGTNGAGKSTLFDIISGKLAPSAGTLALHGLSITHEPEFQRSNRITRLFQDPRLNSVGRLTVAQNLALARYSRRAARIVDGMQCLPHHEALQLLERVDLSPALLSQPMESLSGGQRQLIAFVMATQAIPHLLLLDEPTAALDPQAATTLLVHATRFITRHRVTTLLITHDPLIALSIATRIWVMAQGMIVHQYASHEIPYLRPEQLVGSIGYAQLVPRDV